MFKNYQEFQKRGPNNRNLRRKTKKQTISPCESVGSLGCCSVLQISKGSKRGKQQEKSKKSIFCVFHHAGVLSVQILATLIAL